MGWLKNFWAGDYPLKKGCSDIVREPYRASHHLKTCHSMLPELFFSLPSQWIQLSHCFVGSGGMIFGAPLVRKLLELFGGELRPLI